MKLFKRKPTKREENAKFNETVNTRQCRRARFRRQAKALLSDMKAVSKNPAAL